MTSRRLFQAGGIVVMAGAALLFQASSRMPYQTSLGPGPGFFPYWLSAILFCLGAALAIQATFTAPLALPDDFWPAEGGAGRIVTILAAVAVAALGVERLGFAPSLLVVNLMVLLALGFRSPLPLAAVALSGSFGVYLVFTRWLGVQLPAGVLPF